MNREGFHLARDKTACFFKKLAGVSGRHLGRYPVITISPKAPDHRLDLVQRNFHKHQASLGLSRLLTFAPCQDVATPRLP